MNRRRIDQHLTKKFREWTDSITDENLREDVKGKAFITGGAVASLLLGEEPNDYDVYFTDKDITKRIATYYVGKFNTVLESKYYTNRIGYKTKAFVLDGATAADDIQDNQGINWGSAMLQGISEDRIKIIIRSDGVATENGSVTDELDPMVDAEQAMEEGDETPEGALDKYTPKKDKTPYRPVFLSPNAITLSDGIQLVIRFYGNPAEIHENYDYVHCTNFWLPIDLRSVQRDGLHVNEKALMSLMNKELVYVGSKYPIASIIRLRKFLKRGWWINAGQILKLAFQISELDLTDPVVLESQTCGVDTTYFMQLIDCLKQDMKQDNFEMTNSYFFSVIDKVFGA